VGPLEGLKVVEMAGIGPGPFCAMLLADMGADVVRIDRRMPAAGVDKKYQILNRGRRSISLDLKDPDDLETVLRLIEKADALIEGFRPGVMERLGLGPDACFRRNPAIVYGRMTGWGQAGPLSHAAGHDINYIALTGALHAIGNVDQGPVPPLNLVGDFGGGAMYLAFGLMCGLHETQSSGQGQIVDVAMTDGAAHLMAMMYSLKHNQMWSEFRGANLLDGGAHFYGTFECADGEWVAIGSIEPQFYALLLEKAGVDDERFERQMDAANWPALKNALAQIFRSKTRDQWCTLMEGTDVCFAPVLSMTEAPGHPHNRARQTFVEYDGVVQPAPAPRFSRTEPELSRSPPAPGEHTAEILKDWGIDRS